MTRKKRYFANLTDVETRNQEKGEERIERIQVAWEKSSDGETEWNTEESDSM